MQNNLLIHSLTALSSITLPILEAVQARKVCEIGAGENSKVLNQWLHSHHGELISIDSNLDSKLLNAADAWFIDGDNNWYTTYSQLKQIRECSRSQNHPILIFLHNVGWPYAHRDFYSDPKRIPEEFRHCYTEELGVFPGVTDLVENGFKSKNVTGIALHEGGSKNGVLTAVNDFLDDYPKEFCFANVPAFFGLGVLFDFAHPQADLIAQMITPYHENELLTNLELNRIYNYCSVLKLQAEETSMSKHFTPLEGESIFDPSLQFEKFEKMALDMINVLSDEKDHPDLWALINSLQSPADKAELKLFSEYLGFLQAIPQEEKALKIISVLEAVCLAQSGQVMTAKEKLYKLSEQYEDCNLVRDALSRMIIAYC